MTAPGTELTRPELRTDPAHGGRWTSLRLGGREWLWTNPEPETQRARGRVVPGDGFVDAGGVEECFPTVRGQPDHGDAWSRTWSTAGDRCWVEVPSVDRLTREVTADDATTLSIAYTIAGAPGTPFLHAVHALLDLGQNARLEAPGVAEAVDLDGPRPRRPWPDGLDRLGPDDGTAVCVLLPGCRQAVITDGDAELRLDWDAAGASEFCSLLLWRNLRGWPAGAPYRSIGVEPMVGRAADLGRAAPDEVARIGPSGRFAWTLRLTGARRTPPDTHRTT